MEPLSHGALRSRHLAVFVSTVLSPSALSVRGPGAVAFFAACFDLLVTTNPTRARTQQSKSGDHEKAEEGPLIVSHRFPEILLDQHPREGSPQARENYHRDL